MADGRHGDGLMGGQRRLAAGDCWALWRVVLV
eukprot:CAMPEP_0202875516 /NCGR_PEP_ID=MMETSP1391-20130828/27445_1 /ASSEMBLY_ACC=CAM_ASM_000867 /TAXON_ID=1034604 /ORGANISM="Chlamydomonas leiostraca, Strain SAG 11-49" /LENGTH=31 /DNA_ID= /DNA_START= /DNA_END= /DNA_ORIENTATION=